MIIRPFTAADYEGYATVIGAAYEDPVAADSMRYGDQHRDPKIQLQRWVAEVDGQIVGACSYFQRIRAYHPQRFQTELGVRPEYRGRGIGAALYRQLEEGLAPFDPIAVGARTRADWADAIAFAERRGFVEQLRTWESHLDLAGWAVGPWQASLDGTLAKGYEIRNLTEIRALPDWERRLYELVSEVRWDVPSDEPRTETPFDSFRRSLDSQFVWPEGHLIALHAGEFVGISTLYHSATAGVLTNGLTGVRRPHRGTGIAKALKVRGIQAAQAAGFQTIRTWNESRNERMLAINERLGFVKRPAWITYKLHLNEGAGA